MMVDENLSDMGLWSFPVNILVLSYLLVVGKGIKLWMSAGKAAHCLDLVFSREFKHVVEYRRKVTNLGVSVPHQDAAF